MQNLEQSFGGNICPAKMTLAINAGSAATFKTTGTNAYTVDGVFFTKTALAAQAFSAGHTALAAQQACIFGVFLDNAGNVSTVQGKIASTTDVNNGVASVPLPPSQKGKCCIGMIEVKCGTGTFTPGTTALDAANITFTFSDLMVLPSTNPTS